MRIIFRLTPEADHFLRETASAKRGMLTNRLAEAIEACRFDKLEVVNLRTHWMRTTVEQTAVSIESHHKALLREEAKRRDCSVNALVNAIILCYKAKRSPKGWKDERDSLMTSPNAMRRP